jgi:hypothetical protein
MIALEAICHNAAADSHRLQLFKDIFLAHGALGYGDKTASFRIRQLNEVDRLLVVPLVFGLIPFDAVMLAAAGEPVKPTIKSHLQMLGIPPDEPLLSILKSIADQYSATDPEKTGRTSKRGIANIRAIGARYKSLRLRQANRCAVCGSILVEECDESLDHILPYRLVGDVPDGSNWQILCTQCNSGKADFISSLQAREAVGWLYGRNSKDLGKLSDEGRYVVLRQVGKCTKKGCGRGPMDARLLVVNTCRGALASPMHMTVRCAEHAGDT